MNFDKLTSMRILLCNDDGVQARGLKALYQSLKHLGKIWVVAPLEEKSTTGHSLTLHKPLRIIRYENYGEHYYGVSGSPADCINLGIREIMKQPPHLVISGINRGANLGQDVYYSGTVSAAREAAFMGFRAFAVSMVIDYKKIRDEKKINYKSAGKICLDLVDKLEKIEFPEGTVVNLNVPDLPTNKIKGLRFTHQGFRHYSGGIWKRKDHRGKDYYWVGGTYKGFRNEQGTDCYDTYRGFATVTPLKMDCTDHDTLDRWKGLLPEHSK